MSRHARPSRARRAFGPPTRKAPLLLTAAVAGALFAALPLGLGAAEDSGQAGDIAALIAPAQGGGIGSDVGMPLDAESETGARKDLTAAEAQARLDVLRADRANRVSRDAERAAAAEPDFVAPVVGRLSSCFCQRWGTMHWGIDIAAPMMTPILAVGDGVVTKAGAASGYGNVVYIQHENGDVTVYGHMEVIEVETGDIVAAGEEIARVGSRGYSTGPHLHFEVYDGGLDGERVDPIGWLAARGVRI
ncbi:MAG: M23 family metallopeptidase [Geodermatophilaceae bacterium]|nr:M23 family metallopeptidase [Geodermatophilaceae bacterium]